MELTLLYKLKSKFVARQVGDDLVIVPLTGNVAQMNELFTLNETGRFIWENTDSEMTIVDLASKMTEVYEINIDTATIDINNFLASIKVLTKYL